MIAPRHNAGRLKVANLVLVADADIAFRSALKQAQRTGRCSLRLLFVTDPKDAMHELFARRFCGAIVETSLLTPSGKPLLEAVCGSGLVPSVVAICSAHRGSAEIWARRQNVTLYLVKPVVGPILHSVLNIFCRYRSSACREDPSVSFEHHAGQIER